MKISVIICTYNPDPAIFKRVLAAVSALDTNGLDLELVLIDNNSPEPVKEQFRSQLSEIPFPMKVVSEPRSGLTHARIAGYNNSCGDLLVFFDDDNEPESAYLQEVHKAFIAFPCIGVFGPGKINVAFLGNPPGWIQFNKSYFQERKYNSTRFACTDDWMEFYPPGTGQSMRRQVFDQYHAQVMAGILSASDRKGSSLSSAGDVQLVFESIKLNMAAGVYPEMKLNHLIAERKSSLKYLRRLVFGMASSFPEAFAESFPHYRKVIPCFSNWQIFTQFFLIFWNCLLIKRSPKTFSLHLSESLGRIHASNQTRGFNSSSFWFKLIHLLKLN
jgi:glycosyltransferase involved in cell wall biosynthesis